MSATDLHALSEMNNSALVFYKNISNRVRALSTSTTELHAHARKVKVSAEDVHTIWERALRLEAVVDALNEYSSRQEAQLSHQQRA